MQKRIVPILLALTLALASVPALGQQCNIGVYADPIGTQMTYLPTQGQIFDVYIVMFTEDLMDAAAYEIFVPGLFVDIFPAGTSYGPNGWGLNIVSAGGNNVGLGECVVGFGGNPVIITKYSYIIPGESMLARTISLGPNPDEDPNAVVYSTCPGVLKPCFISNSLFLESPISTESESWGAVKSLYGE